MARPTWKGYISFGLVMIPVNVYGAVEPHAELDLDMLDPRDHARIRYKRVNEKSGREVEFKDIAKGYKLPSGAYVIVTPDDFKRAAATVTKGVQIVDFVPPDQISPIYFDRPYYVQPAKGGEKVYALLRETLKRSRLVGVARAVLHTREHLAALMPHLDGKTLILQTLRFDDELRKPEDVLGDVPEGARVASKEIELAENLVGQMKGEWRPEQYHDEYLKALRGFIEKKARLGDKFVPPEPEQPAPASSTPDIVDLLEQSLARHPSPGGRTRRPPARRPRSGTPRKVARRATRK